MGKLYDMFDIHSSSDLLVDANSHRENLEQRVKEETKPVKTTLDLSLFTVFNAESRKRKAGLWMGVNQKGEVYLYEDLAEQIKAEYVELLLNKKGNILVLREADEQKGLKLRWVKPERTGAKAVYCRELAVRLKELGVQLPVKFKVEYDPELNVWVGKR